MQLTKTRFNHSEWLAKAFRGNVPAEVTGLLDSREITANVLEEMMTQWPPETRQALERLYDLQKAETELLYGTLEALFSKHLEHHP